MKKLYSNFLSCLFAAILCLSMVLTVLIFSAFGAFAAQSRLDYKTNGDNVTLLVSTLTQVAEGNEIEVVLSTDGRKFTQISCPEQYVINGAEMVGNKTVNEAVVSITFKDIAAGQSVRGITATFNGLSNTECSVIVNYKDRDGNILKTESDALRVLFKSDTPNELPSRNSENKQSDVKSDVILAGTPNIKEESSSLSANPVTTLKNDSGNSLSEANETLSKEKVPVQTSSDDSTSTTEALNDTENTTTAEKQSNNGLNSQTKLLVMCLGLIAFAFICAILVAIVTASKRKKEKMKESRNEETETDINDDLSDE